LRPSSAAGKPERIGSSAERAPNHKVLLPASASAAAGALYLLLIDDLARTATAAEIPLGIITALIGAPVFAILLRRTHAGGWRSG
jgi:iron complex transport system permease protein